MRPMTWPLFHRQKGLQGREAGLMGRALEQATVPNNVIHIILGEYLTKR